MVVEEAAAAAAMMTAFFKTSVRKLETRSTWICGKYVSVTLLYFLLLCVPLHIKFVSMP